MAPKVFTVAVFNEETGWSLPAHHVDRIREAAGDRAEVRQARSYAELLEAMPETNYLMSYPLTEEHLGTHGGNLEWIQLIASPGDSSPALWAALERGIRVSTAAPIRAPHVAEHAMALLLASTRRLKESIGAQGEHRWETKTIAKRVRDLSAMAVGVVGAGPIGRAVAHRCAAFGSEVRLYDVRARLESWEAIDGVSVAGMEELDAHLGELDALVVAATYTTVTERMFGRRRLGMLKHGAMLVDVSKGGIVDQKAMLLALRRGRLATAALDVFETEPLPPTSPMWTMPNVILTPHVCAASPVYWERATEVVCENFRRLVAGEGMLDEARAEWYGEAVHA